MANHRDGPQTPGRRQQHAATEGKSVTQAVPGFRPTEEAGAPHDLCFLRLGPGKYTTGFRTPDAVWLDQHDLMPVSPTHFRDYPD
jgi:hypothetical protein